MLTVCVCRVFMSLCVCIWVFLFVCFFAWLFLKSPCIIFTFRLDHFSLRVFHFANELLKQHEVGIFFWDDGRVSAEKASLTSFKMLNCPADENQLGVCPSFCCVHLVTPSCFPLIAHGGTQREQQFVPSRGTPSVRSKLSLNCWS